MGQDTKRVLVVDSGPDNLDQPLKKACGDSRSIAAQLASPGVLLTLSGNAFLVTHFVYMSLIMLLHSTMQSDMYKFRNVQCQCISCMHLP